MSARPLQPQEAPDRKPVTLPRLAEMKAAGEPIVMVTAYDYPSALVAEEAGVDVVLVGDSAAMVVLGFDATTPVGMDEMTTMAAAVRRGLKTPLLVGDLPFGSYERSNEHAIDSAQRFVREAGCDAVKLERGGASVERARAIVRSGIPVMGHVGLTPQSASALGGYRAQGKTAAGAATVAEEALALQAAGCFAIVFEAIPAAIAEAIVDEARDPGDRDRCRPGTDGQVLVFHDLLGIHAAAIRPSSSSATRTSAAEMVSGMRDYVDEVRNHRFPGPEHQYAVEPAELAEFKRYLDQETLASADWDWSATEI